MTSSSPPGLPRRRVAPPLSDVRKPELTINSSNAELFFDGFVRDANVDDLERCIADVAHEVKNAAPLVPHALTALVSGVTHDANYLLERVKDERTLFTSTMKTLESVIKRDRKEAETAIERLTVRAESLEHQLIQAVRDHLLATGELVYATHDDDEDDPFGKVDRTEAEDNGSGVFLVHAGLQCLLRPNAADEALRVLHNIAMKEKMVNHMITHMEGLIVDIDEHDHKLERELACPQCGVVRDENVVLWPCGHAFCGHCVFGAQTERGEFVCPSCQNTTTEAPIPNVVVNMMAARVNFKRSGTCSLLQSLQHFRSTVERIDDTFKRETDAHYRNVPRDDEFVSLRDAQRLDRATAQRMNVL
jgi:rubrerythrin